MNGTAAARPVHGTVLLADGTNARTTRPGIDRRRREKRWLLPSHSFPRNLDSTLSVRICYRERFGKKVSSAVWKELNSESELSFAIRARDLVDWHTLGRLLPIDFRQEHYPDGKRE